MFKKITAVTTAIAICCAAFAWAQVTPRRFSLSQNLTGSAPVTACSLSGAVPNTTGFNLAGVESYFVCVQANSSQTLSGAGTINLYFYDVDLAIWTKEPDADESVTASGIRTQCFPKRVLNKTGRGCLYPVPNAVTVSSGTTVLTTVTGVF